jgi:hypothetical protein
MRAPSAEAARAVADIDVFLRGDMLTSGKYQVDRGVLLQKSYYLLCFFFANREFEQRTVAHDLLAQLQRRYFETEVSRSLIELAIGMRVIDDQMKKTPATNRAFRVYKQGLITADAIAKHCFDGTEKRPTFRQICNKVIHSETLDLHYELGEKRYHFSGYISLSGQDNGKAWNLLLPKYSKHHSRHRDT